MKAYSDYWQGILERKAKKPKKRFDGAHCARCGKDGDITIDHIIPLAILNCFGFRYNDEWNLQPLCKRCNGIKGHSLDPKNPKTIPTLMRYIERWKALHMVERKRNVYVFRTLKVTSLTPGTRHYVANTKLLKEIYRKQTGAI